MQNIFTVAKIGTLAVLVLLGIWFSTDAAREANFTHFWRKAQASRCCTPIRPIIPPGWIGTITLVGVAMVGSLFAMDAWNNVTFTAAEVKNPSRNLPLSLAFGAGLVVLLYTLANVAYLRVLPISGDPAGATAVARGIEFAAEGRVGHRRRRSNLRPGRRR